MPILETDCLTQEAVLWSAAATFDDYGRPKVNAAIEVMTRWELENRESTDNLNNTVTIDSTVAVDREILVHSIMWLGKLKDLPSPPTDLREVIDYKSIPDVKGRKFRRRVLLIKHSDTLPTLA